jgi:NAD(P)-dependent dehydrogenase (short-subunit alcohol dehydrogenase family)
MNVVENTAVLITGANRGIGEALVTGALDRGAARVYAGSGVPLNHADPRVTPSLLDVNVLGPLALINALRPKLKATSGKVVNNLSINALAPLPLIPGYSMSKAAALSMTRSPRTLLAPRGVGVLTGPVDIEMSAGVDIPKARPREVADANFDGVDRHEDEIFPDAIAAQFAESWRSSGAKALELEYRAYAAAMASA